MGRINLCFDWDTHERERFIHANISTSVSLWLARHYRQVVAVPPGAAGVNFFHRKTCLLAQCGKLWKAHIIGGCYGVCEGQSVFAQKHPQKKASSRNQQPIELGECAGKVSWRRVNE